jgi:hypothetical protein
MHPKMNAPAKRFPSQDGLSLLNNHGTKCRNDAKNLKLLHSNRTETALTSAESKTEDTQLLLKSMLGRVAALKAFQKQVELKRMTFLAFHPATHIHPDRVARQILAYVESTEHGIAAKISDLSQGSLTELNEITESLEGIDGIQCSFVLVSISLNHIPRLWSLLQCQFYWRYEQRNTYHGQWGHTSLP